MAAGTEQKTNDGMKIIGLKRDLGHPFSVCVPCICVCVCVVCVHVCVCVCACVWSLILQAMSLARGLCPGLTPRLALTSITSNEPLHIHTHTCTTHLNTHKRLIKYILFSSFSREPLMETHQDNKCVSVCVCKCPPQFLSSIIFSFFFLNQNVHSGYNRCYGPRIHWVQTK